MSIPGASGPSRTGPVYEVTESGRRAWQSQDGAIPRDFRLVLWLIDFYGEDYLTDLTRRYAASTLPGLLGELEELNLIRRRTLLSRSGLDNTGKTHQAFTESHRRRFEEQLRIASQSLLKGKADVMLPDGDGFDILRRLRTHKSYAALPVILLTAKTEPEDIACGLETRRGWLHHEAIFKGGASGLAPAGLGTVRADAHSPAHTASRGFLLS